MTLNFRPAFAKADSLKSTLIAIPPTDPRERRQSDCGRKLPCAKRPFADAPVTLRGSPLRTLTSSRFMSVMGFNYDISLQVRHPDADPNDIVRGVGLPASRCWKIGEPRSTPAGAALPGYYGETYCAFDFGSGSDGELAERLRILIATLMPRRNFFHSLKTTGGSLNFFVTWKVGERGEMFDCSLLSELASLGVDLGIEPIRAD